MHIMLMLIGLLWKLRGLAGGGWDCVREKRKIQPADYEQQKPESWIAEHVSSRMAGVIEPTCGNTLPHLGQNGITFLCVFQKPHGSASPAKQRSYASQSKERVTDFFQDWYRRSRSAAASVGLQDLPARHCDRSSSVFLKKPVARPAA